MKVTEAEIVHEPRHWNHVCGCFIPEAWTALLYSEDGEPLPKWPCGSTREEAEANVRREFPNAQIN